MWKYGTAGFRYYNDDILQISDKIGKGLVYLDRSKFGVMITASHNTDAYNGVKIVDENGIMLSKNEEKILENIVNFDIVLEKKNTKKFIVFGRDTRKNSIEIMHKIIDEMKKWIDLEFIDEGLIHTPLLHWLSAGRKRVDYEIIKNISLPFNLWVDCAGGVPFHVLSSIKHPNLQCLMGNKLNINCGSEYVMNHKKIHFNVEGWGCSLDGDGDRMIFWKKENENIQILDGNDILTLWSYYCKKKFGECCTITTPYFHLDNQKFLQKNNITVIFKPTGIKNLIEETKNHHRCVYFEANGHGSAKNIDIIHNDLIGDGIYNIFTTMLILKELHMTFDDWLKLVPKSNDVLEFSIPSDGWNLKTNNIGDKIIEPMEIQEFIDKLIEKFGGKIFIRPSGTEPIIRIYICGKNNNIVRDKIKSFLLCKP